MLLMRLSDERLTRARGRGRASESGSEEGGLLWGRALVVLCLLLASGFCRVLL